MMAKLESVRVSASCARRHMHTREKPRRRREHQYADDCDHDHNIETREDTQMKPDVVSARTHPNLHDDVPSTKSHQKLAQSIFVADSRHLSLGPPRTIKLPPARTHKTRAGSSLAFQALLVLALLTIGTNQQSAFASAHLYNEQYTTGTYSEPNSNGRLNLNQPDQAPESGSQSQATTSSTSTASANAACFGGLQTFEKISMSSFENPSGSGSSTGSNSGGGGSFGSGGILVQQDDQALTSECVNLCRAQSNCLSFVIDYNKFECKSYATTQQELQQEFAIRFQSARATNGAPQGNSSTGSAGAGSAETSGEQLNGYQASASSSSVNLQQLLPSASSNYFEKICLDGVANRNQFSDVCGQGRLWTIERVVDSFLDGFVEKEVTNVNGKDECSKLCIFEAQFVCRSADYDHHSRLCRLSKEDRRTQPQAMRYVANSNRQYLENQCATPGPSSCVYETKRNLGIISMDALKFAQTAQDCQMKCNQESTFNCRSYSFHQQRCFLSGDDSVSLNSNLIKLPQKQGWMFGEKKCLVELCTKGVFSYERITGYTLRSALSTSIDLMMPGSSTLIKSVRHANPSSTNDHLLPGDSLHSEASSQTRVRRLINTPPPPPPPSLHGAHYQNGSGSALASAMMMMMMMKPDSPAPDPDLVSTQSEPLLEASTSSRHTRTASLGSNLAITEHCRHSCDLGYLNCPAFTIDYKNNRCQRLDRNSQGRHHELVARDGHAYYEKICLRVPEIMSMCQDKYWIFERVIGYELAPRLYDKSLKFVQSRRDCEEYCLEEKQFQCRSALYNDETSDCKLSRYNRRLAQHEGGYYRNFNARLSYLENNCVRDRQLEQRKQCHFERAKEEPAYPTYTEQIELATASSSLAPTNNHPPTAEAAPIRQNQSMAASAGRYGSASFCEQLCNDNTKFECHSFGYYASTAQCFLSGDDSISAGDMATTPSTGFVYYEKKCRLGAAPGAASLDTTTDEGPALTTTPNSTASVNPYFQPSSNGAGAGGHHHGQESPQTGPAVSIDDGYGNQSQGASNGTQDYHTDTNSQAFRPTSQPAAGAGLRPPTTGMMAGSPPMGDAANPDMYKCGLGHTFVYQRISGFEPIGGYLTLLLKNNEQPGIVADCAELCKRAFECRAFVVDYNNNQCFAMLENSSIGLLNLRQTLGKDYFEGFCAADHLLQTSASTNCRNRTWIMDKIVDQAVFGVQHQKLIQSSDGIQCRRACLQERLFVCKSAMYDSSTADCKLYSIDRESIPQMRLLFTKGVDFFENQCQITSSSCPYDAIERDMTIITTTRSVQARSTFDCELACNSEASFNCRSYTYLDQYPSLPNMCLLSSDSRSTSQRGSVREHQRTLYAERNCYYRRPRFPGGGTGGAVNRYNNFQPLAMPGPLYTPGPPVNSLTIDPYAQRTPMSSNPLPMQPESPNAPTPPEVPSRINSEQEGAPPSNVYDVVGPTPLAGSPCEPHQFTFERTFGYDFKLAPKERAPIAPTIGIAVACQQECLRRGDRCKSFVVDYGLPYQSCFLMENQVGANKRLLVRSANSAYFEKVCLPRTGLALDAEPLYSHAPMTAAAGSNHLQLQALAAGTPLMDPSQSLDISPSYSHEPWTLQPGPATQLPYYSQQPHQNQQHQHQQHHLVQNYPSRACAKLWTFERFVNHNFTASVDKLVENSLTRAHCETLCLNEASFSCRSATYDYANKLCRLFKSTRRTMMSQFIDLESTSGAHSGSALPAAPSGGGDLADSHPGTVHVLDTTAEAIQTAASSVESNELLATRRQTGGRQLSQQQPPAQQATAESSSPGRNIDYLENTCTPEPSSCQYRQIYDQFSPYIDKVNHANSLADCQRQCDQERLFSCKSINFDATSKNCMLVNEDLISLARGQQTGSHSPLLPKRNTIYSEKGNCEMISVQCNSQEMLVAINFDSPFRGRIMAKGNPEECFILGDGQTSLQFSIVFGPKCNSRQEGHNTFVNEVVIQQHPVIMTESDKTVRVMCAFEAPDQTITLKTPSSRDNKTAGIDVGTQDSGRTRHDKQQFNSVVSNKAPPPSVVLRILDQNGRDASMINLGDDLVLKIQMQMMDGKGSALGIFARNLAARSSNGESLLLIDAEGCPIDPLVFPALEVDPKDGRSLQSTFKAFRFPSSGLVNFEVQIRFCPERCQPVDCKKANHRSRSYGKRRKRQAEPGGGESNFDLGLSSLASATSIAGRAPILQSTDEQSQSRPPPATVSLDSLSTVMKPGKAFEFVRKLMLPQPESPTNYENTNLNNQDPKNGPTAGENQGQMMDRENKLGMGSSGAPVGASAPEVAPETHTEDFESHAKNSGNLHGANSETEQVMNDQQQGGIGANQFSQPDRGGANAAGDLHRQHSSATLSSELHIEQHKNDGSPRDEQIGPSTQLSPPARDAFAQHFKPIHAPYGDFQHQPARDQQQAPQTSELPPSSDPPMISDDASPPRQQLDEPKQEHVDNGDGRFQSAEASHSLDHDQQPSMNRQQNLVGSKDMPLRFSILVAENQLPSSSIGQATLEQPPTIMNSTNMDIDHIVIPGKKGQIEDGETPGSNSLSSSAASAPTTSDARSPDTYLARSQLIGRQRETSKRNASYEQTFDALPSNSVSSEIPINHHQNSQELASNQLHPMTRQMDHHHQQQQHQQHQQQHQASQPETSTSESAASHDCQAEISSKGKLRAIIWTGGIVIGLNVCLVLLSLVLYFRKMHLRKNHTIVRSSSSDCDTSRSDCLGIHSGTSGSRFSRGSSQWPSVILKSKNKLGTSLKTHEQFFCKLNSKPDGIDARLEQEFNWPNLSTGSSRSTLSSLAGPVPSTSIRINQMRTSLKTSPFDAHSSLRNGNFIPDQETHKGIDESSDLDGEYPARYTNNIDVLRSERF